MSEPPPPASRGFIFNLIDRLLKWLDKPWKALALAGLAILVALGWSGWTSRDTLTDIWRMSAGRPILKRSELPETLQRLRAETGADIVGFWSLNLSANAMSFELGIGLHGKPWVFTPTRLPAIRDPGNASPRGLSDIMAGQIICRAPSPDGDGDLFNRRMLADHIHRICIVPVPPAPNILVGVLLVAWINDPDPSTEEAAATQDHRWFRGGNKNGRLRAAHSSGRNGGLGVAVGDHEHLGCGRAGLEHALHCAGDRAFDRLLFAVSRGRHDFTDRRGGQRHLVNHRGPASPSPGTRTQRQPTPGSHAQIQLPPPSAAGGGATTPGGKYPGSTGPDGGTHGCSGVGGTDGGM
jgi:hypothetical protein